MLAIVYAPTTQMRKIRGALDRERANSHRPPRTSKISRAPVEKANQRTVANRTRGSLFPWQQMVLRGVYGELEAIRHAQLLENAREMVLDGLLADVERVRDFLVARGSENEANDLHLARSEDDSGPDIRFRTQA